MSTYNKAAIDALEQKTAEAISKAANTNPWAVESTIVAEVINAEDVVARAPVFLATNRLVKSQLSAFIGDPSTGKSTLISSVIASVTRGQPIFPDDHEQHTPQDVILVSNEDDVATQIKPKLIAAGADMKRVKIIPGLKDAATGRPQPMNLNDFLAVEKVVVPKEAPSNRVEHNIGLVVVDPLISFLPSGSDINQANKVRPLMDKLLNFAQTYKISVLLNIHLRKTAFGKSFKNIGGSGDFAAVVGGIFNVGYFGDDRSRRFLAVSRIKGAGIDESKVRTIEFEIAGKKVTLKNAKDEDVEAEVGCINWLGYSNVTDRQLSDDKRPECVERRAFEDNADITPEEEIQRNVPKQKPQSQEAMATELIRKLVPDNSKPVNRQKVESKLRAEIP